MLASDRRTFSGCMIAALIGACSGGIDSDDTMSGVGADAADEPNDGGGQQWVTDGATCAPDLETCAAPDAGDAAVSTGAPDGAVPRDAEPDADEPPSDGGTPPPITYKVDLLFVVDNSASMLEKQAKLREQFPMLLSRLLSNTAIGGGDDVPGAQDVHLGVVSSDLGTPGLNTIRLCEGLGDNGVLNNVAAMDAVGCSATAYEPRYLSYVAGTDDAAQLSTDFSCISALGNEGCGFEQQLESMLKAVWPGNDGSLVFATDLDGMGATGQSGEGFPNGDFVRRDEDDVSVLAVVMVTDEEDCSASSVAHLDPSLPGMETLGLRCYYETLRPEPNNIYDVERYVEGLRALRPGREQRVVFGAIVGVPPGLVTEQEMAAVDFADADSRAAHYRTILEHPLMQQAVDDNATPDDSYDDALFPSCTTETDGTLAWPPPRIVEVARGFGEQGFVQSICANDWSYTMELLAQRIAKARRE